MLAQQMEITWKGMRGTCNYLIWLMWGRYRLLRILHRTIHRHARRGKERHSRLIGRCLIYSRHSPWNIPHHIRSKNQIKAARVYTRTENKRTLFIPTTARWHHSLKQWARTSLPSSAPLSPNNLESECTTSSIFSRASWRGKGRRGKAR